MSNMFITEAILIVNQQQNDKMLIQVPSWDFFTSSNPFSKNHDSQKRFLQDVMLFVIKGFLPLRTNWSLFGYKD